MIEFVLLYGECWLIIECPSLVSDYGRGGTPGSIPNPEVKPPSADGTAE